VCQTDGGSTTTFAATALLAVIAAKATTTPSATMIFLRLLSELLSFLIWVAVPSRWVSDPAIPITRPKEAPPGQTPLSDDIGSRAMQALFTKSRVERSSA
jgi:hypothetical protein